MSESKDNKENVRGRLLSITALANDYCVALQSTFEMEKDEFVGMMINLLPRLYWEFADFSPAPHEPSEEDNDELAPADPDELISLEEEPRQEYFASYVDEDFYDSIRRGVERLLGPEDVYLDTFEEDMKSSDTPIAASVSEGLADIFQSLFNFTSIVKDTEGEALEPAYRECRENFAGYWAQTLVNVLRPLNRIFFE